MDMTGGITSGDGGGKSLRRAAKGLFGFGVFHLAVGALAMAYLPGAYEAFKGLEHGVASVLPGNGINGGPSLDMFAG